MNKYKIRVEFLDAKTQLLTSEARKWKQRLAYVQYKTDHGDTYVFMTSLYSWSDDTTPYAEDFLCLPFEYCIPAAAKLENAVVIDATRDQDSVQYDCGVVFGPDNWLPIYGMIAQAGPNRIVKLILEQESVKILAVILT